MKYTKIAYVNDANNYLYIAHKFYYLKKSKKNKCDYFAESIFIELERLNYS